jgi:hypothetical protein
MPAWVRKAALLLPLEFTVELWTSISASKASSGVFSVPNEVTVQLLRIIVAPPADVGPPSHEETISLLSPFTMIVVSVGVHAYT